MGLQLGAVYPEHAYFHLGHQQTLRLDQTLTQVLIHPQLHFEPVLHVFLLEDLQVGVDVPPVTLQYPCEYGLKLAYLVEGSFDLALDILL